MHLIVQAAITVGDTAEVCCEDNGLMQGLPAPGYFMLENDPSSLTVCTPAVACKGGYFGQKNCETGYSGSRCSACQSTEPKYYRSDGQCEICDSIIPMPVLIILAIIAFVALALFADSFLSKVQNTAELIAPALILMTFFQTLSLLVKVEVTWPPRLRELMSYASFMNFNVELASPECSGTFDADARLNLVLFSPVAVLCLIFLYAGAKFFTHRGEITLPQLLEKIRTMAVGALVLMSTFFVKGVLGGWDCTTNKDGRSYLDIEPEMECNSETNDAYRRVLTKATVGFIIWSAAMALLTYSFTRETGKARYAFLTQKMESQWYWWELLLLLRKLLIMACGLLNTSTPFRGWYLSSLVIIFSLTAHAYARPFLDPWVDATELISLWSTLFIFQGGMVWTGDPDSELAHLIEYMAIGLVTGTAALALYVELRVWRRRHGLTDEGAGSSSASSPREKEFDAVDDNPLFRSRSLITVTFTGAERPLDLQFEQQASGAFKLVGVGDKLQGGVHTKDLVPGLILVEAGGISVGGMELAELEQLISEGSSDADVDLPDLTLVLRPEAAAGDSTAAGDAIAAANAVDRVGQLQASLSMSTLISDVI